MQIVNNVAEEWSDLGKTDFATKDELCATINWLRNTGGEEVQNLLGKLSQIAVLALAATHNEQ